MGLQKLGIIVQLLGRHLISQKSQDWLWDSFSLHFSAIWELFPWGEADHSHSYGAEVRNAWRCTSSSTCHYGMTRDNMLWYAQGQLVC